MKTIKSLIIGICIVIVSFLASCSEDETVYETGNTEIEAKRDKGDVTGGPNGKNGVTSVKDSIINTTKSTGGKGDVTGDPNN